jgi:hypothetical protein
MNELSEVLRSGGAAGGDSEPGSAAIRSQGRHLIKKDFSSSGYQDKANIRQLKHILSLQPIPVVLHQ